MQLILALESYLEDGVGSRRIIISTILGRDSHSSPVGDILHQIIAITDLCLRQANDIDIILGVLPGEEYILVIEQVIQLATVNFVKGDPDLKIIPTLDDFEDVL
jgi:hypothetical protein